MPATLAAPSATATEPARTTTDLSEPYAMMGDVRIDRSRTGLVGRDADLAGLVSAAEDPATRMVLLSGDAGVGKTRLVGEAVQRLRAEGWRSLTGHCLDFGETPMPYLPFAEILGAAVAREDGLARHVAESHPALARLVPAAAETVPALRSVEELDRAEVFEAVHAVLEELAERVPLLVVVEDAHWADASTRDLLSFLLSRRFSGRVLFLVTFRSDEMHRRHPLRRRVAEWVRLPGVVRVQLEPLAPAAVRSLVELLVGGYGEQYDADVERIVQRAQGNAFYVEELVGAFLGGGWSLPDDLADLLLVRLDRLDEQAREVVHVAAVGGQRVSHELLARVAPVSPEVLDQALRSAIEGHVLVRTGPSAYAFRHALLGEAVYDDLLPGERMRLHTAYAEAVRELSDGHAAADLARHALASHDLPAALVASVQAGEQALASGGPEEAARHLTTALEIYDRAAPQLEEPPDEAGLVARAAEALAATGRPETAIALVERRLRALPPDASAQARARLTLARVEAMRETELTEPPSPITAEALALAGPEATPLRARILATHANMLAYDGKTEDARAAAEEAIELADRLDLPRIATDAGMTLTLVEQRGDAGEQGRLRLEQLLQQAQRRGDLAGQLRGHFRLANIDYELGRLAAARERWAHTAELARHSGRPWAVLGSLSRMLSAVTAVMQGDWDDALAIADFTDEDPPPTARAMLESVRVAVAAGRGDVTALDRLPALRERWHREGLIAVIGGAAAMELLARRDGAAAAVSLYDDMCALLVPLWGPDFGARVRLVALALGTLADEAPRTPTATRAEVRQLLDRVAAEAAAAMDNQEDAARAFSIEGRAWSVRLEAEHLRARWLLGGEVDLEQLLDRWERSRALFGELGHRLEEARSRARLAPVLRAIGRTEEAREHTEAARRTARALGAVPLLEELGAADGGPARTADLTPREQEILALVADGRSNAEIGRQLFISAKTVSVHVSNVMGKLGASSRTEAVALARRAGLLS